MLGSINMGLTQAIYVDDVQNNRRHGFASPGALCAPLLRPYLAAIRCVHRVTQAARCHEGFTLIEVLIATAFLAVSFLGLAAMSLGTIRGVSYSQNLATATTLAREQLEGIINADYDAVIAANYPQENYNTMAGYEQFQRAVTIADATPEPSAKTVIMTVSWRNEAGTVRTVTLDTVITQ